jgi:hypothetical protein
MHLTAKFKLRMSQRKREIVDHALREYAIVLRWLLELAQREIDRLGLEARVETKSGRVYFPHGRVAALLPPLRECPGDIHSSLRDAARRDVAAMLSGFLALREQGYEPGFPSARSERPAEYVAALDNLAAAADVNEPSWRQLAGDLARKGALIPPAALFPRLDGSAQARNAALLTDPTTGKYFALLFLLPARHHLGIPLETPGNLVPVGVEEAQPFISRSRTAIVCPIECGNWHRDKFLESGAVPRTARLYRDRQGDYYFTVAFEMPDPEPVEMTGAVMAVVASWPGLLAYAVANEAGEIIESGDYAPQATRLRAVIADWQREVARRQERGRSVEGFSLRRLSTHAVHEIANDIVDKARTHGAQILIQAPGRARGQRPATGRKRRRHSLPVAQVRQTLEYKAEAAGLPAPRWAKLWRKGEPGDQWMHLSRVCSSCGFVAPKGKPQNTFSCPTCGEKDTSVNLAMVVAKAAAAG